MLINTWKFDLIQMMICLQNINNVQGSDTSQICFLL